MSNQFDAPEMRYIRAKVTEVILNVDALVDAESVTAAMMLLSPLVDGIDNETVNAWAWASSLVGAAALLLDTLAQGLDQAHAEVLRDVLDLDPSTS